MRTLRDLHSLKQVLVVFRLQDGSQLTHLNLTHKFRSPFNEELIL